MVAASSDVEEASVLEVYLVRYVDHEVVPPDGATHLPPCMSVIQCSSASGGIAIQWVCIFSLQWKLSNQGIFGMEEMISVMRPDCKGCH